MESLDSNKKILLTIAVFIASIAVLVLTLKIANNSAAKNNPVSTTVNQDGYVEYVDSENNSDANVYATTQEQTTVKVTQPQNADNNISTAVSDTIYAYMTGQYYIDAVMVADGTETPVKMAIDGKNFQTSADLQGIEVSILYKNNTVYFINQEAKTYILLSDVLMQEVDFDLSEISEITEYLNLTQYNFTDFERYSDKYDGYKCDCYKYYNDDMSVIFYFRGDELKKVDMGNGSGVVSSSVEVNEFSPEVPENMMSLKGLTKTNLIGFFGQALY